MYRCWRWVELEHGSKAALLFGTCTFEKIPHLSSRLGHNFYRQCNWCYTSENNQDRIQRLHCYHFILFKVHLQFQINCCIYFFLQQRLLSFPVFRFYALSDWSHIMAIIFFISIHPRWEELYDHENYPCLNIGWNDRSIVLNWRISYCKIIISIGIWTDEFNDQQKFKCNAQMFKLQMNSLRVQMHRLLI